MVPSLEYDQSLGLFVFNDYSLFKLLRSQQFNIMCSTLTTSSSQQNSKIDLNFRSRLDPPYTLSPMQVSFLSKLKNVISFQSDQENEESIAVVTNLTRIEFDHLLGTIESQDSLWAAKQLVFNDLTESKQMYVTDALKFGGHFLAYQGDALLFHAKFLVAVSVGGSIEPTAFQAFHRAANSAKKNLLVAMVNVGTKEVSYCVISHTKDFN